MPKIYFKTGYKYVLANDYSIQLLFAPRDTICTDFIAFYPDGRMVIRKGYAWDGPSGPTWDTNDFMRGSLVHDALYQLIREGHLPISRKTDADSVLRTICREDGMGKLRAWYVYHGVKRFAMIALDPGYMRGAREAP